MISEKEINCVAIALHNENHIIKAGKPATKRDWDFLCESGKNNYKRKAKAAIEAYKNLLTN